MKTVLVGVVLLFVLGMAFVLTTTPIQINDVKNGELALRHYNDYRLDAKVATYFAQMSGGRPTGKLYGVELLGTNDFSRRLLIQFSTAGVTDFNPGTMVKTIPADSDEANSYLSSFAEVRTKYETQKWTDRVSYMR